MWLLLSLATAFCAGTADALAKQALSSQRSQTVAWVRVGWGALFLFPFIFFAPPPSDPKVFWTVVLINLPFEVAATLLFQKALKISPISLVIPYLAFTPVFILGLSWIISTERPTLLGVTGVVLVTLGAFFLQENHREGGNLSRFIPKEKGPVLMLIVSFIFALTTIMAKKAIQVGSPLYFSGIYYVIIAACLLPFQWGSKTWLKEIFSRPVLFSAIGLLEGAGALFQFIAMKDGNIAFVISLKRLSLLLAVVYGWIFFNERNILSRATGSLLMMAGAALIAFGP